MAGVKAARASFRRFPTRAVALWKASGIESQSADRHVDMAVLCPDGDPFARAIFAIVQEAR